MRTFVFLVLLNCGIQWGVANPTSTEPARVAKSVQVDRNASAQSKKQILQDALDSTFPALRKDGPRKTQAAPSLSRNFYQHYSFYAIDTFLLDDFDDDGYFHQFSVSFDSDISEGRADVYAILSLSLDGGPWNYFHTTDVFTLIGTSTDDSIEIASILEEGYPPGQYDILIEIYEVESNAIVLVAGPDESTALRLLPLEDMGFDESYNTYIETEVTANHQVTGTGSMGLVTIILLSLITLRRGCVDLFKLVVR